ncbi:hypothetical protein GYA13_00545 [Candidatus Kuenenbacteria bacterium]|nr:hypothetical protein [Candidatus Kuenenbacteria bacterium]
MPNKFDNVKDEDFLDVMGYVQEERARAMAAAILRLKKSIDEFNAKSSEQTRKMIRLTKWITGLTMAMLVAVIVQIVLIIKNSL